MNELQEKPVTADKLQSECETLQARRAALSLEIAAQERRLEAAREDLITGKTGASELVTEANSRTVALREAIDALDQRIAERIASQSDAAKTEARAIVVQSLADIANDGAAHFADLLRAREEASAVLVPLVERMAISYEAISACRRRFVEIGMREESGLRFNESTAYQFQNTEQLAAIKAARDLMDEVIDAGGDLDIMGWTWGNAETTVVDNQSLHGIQWPPLPMGRAINQAFSDRPSTRDAA